MHAPHARARHPSRTPSKHTRPRPPGAGGTVRNTSACPPNYPASASLPACGHTSFVELDSAMAYKYALGYAATGDERYAQRAAEILRAWASTNREFGVPTANGPLEASWWAGGRGLWAAQAACGGGLGMCARAATRPQRVPCRKTPTRPLWPRRRHSAHTTLRNTRPSQGLRRHVARHGAAPVHVAGL